MGRLEKFREARRTKRRYIFAFCMFFVLALPGVCIADYSVNNVMKNQRQLGILTFKKINNSYIEVIVLDKKIYVNTMYIQRDLQNLKRKLSKSSAAK